jgi:acetyltransferase-like isoleucine patch superfamily enzyme
MRRLVPARLRRLHAPGVSLGSYSYFLGEVRRFKGDGTTRVTIGNYCSISESVMLLAGGEHRPDWVTTSPIRVMMRLPGAFADGLPTSRGDITIGNDVWVGHGATILSGVSIGDGAVIGAGAVVRRTVRPYAIVVGNPARETRRRFSDEQVDALIRIAWWSWPAELVADRVDQLLSGDVDGFIRAYDPAPDSPTHAHDSVTSPHRNSPVTARAGVAT